MMSTAKIEFAIASFRFSGEGSEPWLSAELQKAISRAVELKELFAQELNAVEHTNAANVGVSTPSALGINSIAAKLLVKSGSDLVMAAAFSPTRGDKAQVSRSEIVAEMKKATSFFKTSFASNLSNYLITLVKEGRLLEQASENYAISAQARSEIESKLA